MTTLFPHQQSFLDRWIKEKAVLNSSQMGTGKTISSLSLVNQLRSNTIIVCPAFLCSNWENEIKKFYPDLLNRTIVVTPKYKYNMELITIVSYGRLKQVEDAFFNAKVVIADEAAILSTLTNKTTKLFESYLQVARPTYLTLISGTPIRNCVGDVFSLMNMVAKVKNDVDFLRKYRSRWIFENYFSNAIKINLGGRQIIKFNGVKNVPELRELVTKFCHKTYLKDVIKLPEFSSTYITVDGSTSVNDAELLEAFETGKPLATIKALSELSKVDATVELLMTDTTRPLLIFGDHRLSTEQVYMQLQQRDWKVALINGSVSMDDRTAIVKDFQDGKLDALIATIGSVGLGLTLTKSNTIYFIGVSWSVSANAQAAARIMRIGQENECRYIYIVRKGGTDEMITKVLNAKQKIVEKVLGE